MWRRLAIQIRTLAPAGSVFRPMRSAVTSSGAPRSLLRPVVAFSRHFSASGISNTLEVEDVVPIATGHEREELEAELQGRDILEINHPSGPFGTRLDVVGPGGPPDRHGDEDDYHHH